MVEWKRLSEICEIKGEYGLSVPSKPFDGVRYIRITDITDDGKLNSDCVSADYNEITKVPLEEGDLLFARTGATVGKTLMYLKEYGKCLYAGYLIRYRVNREVVLPKYVFHFTHSNKYNLWVKSNLVEGAQPNINAQKYNSLEIPIPSLQAQSRIVSILDTFTSSISNLKQQIEERRKQYEYERDLLLDLEGKEGVEMKKLGEVAKVLRGKRLTKNLLDDNAPYPVFHGGIEPLGRYRDYNREANTVMVINVGASAGTVGFCDCKFWSSDGCFCISHSEVLNNKFLFYYLETKMHYLQSQVRHAGIPTLDNPIIEKILVPLLSLQAQSRIVSILDTFEQSIANLEEQLAMREKQYEYYREKLLRFEEA